MEILQYNCYTNFTIEMKNVTNTNRNYPIQM